MKKSRAETEACALAIAWAVCYGVGCYLHSMAVIAISSLFVGVLLACSWRIERLERRISYYRRELDRQIRAEIEPEPEEKEEHARITISKGA